MCIRDRERGLEERRERFGGGERGLEEEREGVGSLKSDERGFRVWRQRVWRLKRVCVCVESEESARGVL
eukprot:2947451-Rhodomonas_salina.2